MNNIDDIETKFNHGGLKCNIIKEKEKQTFIKDIRPNGPNGPKKSIVGIIEEKIEINIEYSCNIDNMRLIVDNDSNIYLTDEIVAYQINKEYDLIPDPFEIEHNYLQIYQTGRFIYIFYRNQMWVIYAYYTIHQFIYQEIELDEYDCCDFKVKSITFDSRIIRFSEEKFILTLDDIYDISLGILICVYTGQKLKRLVGSIYKKTSASNYSYIIYKTNKKIKLLYMVYDRGEEDKNEKMSEFDDHYIMKWGKLSYDNKKCLSYLSDRLDMEM